MSTRNVRANLEDHLAIRDLIDRYTDAVNRRDWAAAENVFCAEDGTWDVGGPNVEGFSFLFKGAKAVAEGMAQAIENTEFCFQENQSVVIDVDGDRATARCGVRETARLSNGGPSIQLLGMYSDDIRRDADGEWRFAYRKFRFIYTEMSPLPGTSRALSFAD